MKRFLACLSFVIAAGGAALAQETPQAAPQWTGPEVTLQTTMGDIVVTVDTVGAPKTAEQFLALVKAGYFNDIAVYRIERGFVVQLGDPGGDGFGGSGTPLRCETSPSPFAPLDVGMALAGRDTGSSQLFVTTDPDGNAAHSSYRSAEAHTSPHGHRCSNKRPYSKRAITRLRDEPCSLGSKSRGAD